MYTGAVVILHVTCVLIVFFTIIKRSSVNLSNLQVNVPNNVTHAVKYPEVSIHFRVRKISFRRWDSFIRAEEILLYQWLSPDPQAYRQIPPGEVHKEIPASMSSRNYSPWISYCKRYLTERCAWFRICGQQDPVLPKWWRSFRILPFAWNHTSCDKFFRCQLDIGQNQLLQQASWRWSTDLAPSHAPGLALLCISTSREVDWGLDGDWRSFQGERMLNRLPGKSSVGVPRARLSGLGVPRQ